MRVSLEIPDPTFGEPALTLESMTPGRPVWVCQYWCLDDPVACQVRKGTVRRAWAYPENKGWAADVVTERGEETLGGQAFFATEADARSRLADAVRERADGFREAAAQMEKQMDAAVERIAPPPALTERAAATHSVAVAFVNAMAARVLADPVRVVDEGSDCFRVDIGTPSERDDYNRLVVGVRLRLTTTGRWVVSPLALAGGEIEQGQGIEVLGTLRDGAAAVVGMVARFRSLEAAAAVV